MRKFCCQDLYFKLETFDIIILSVRLITVDNFKAIKTSDMENNLFSFRRQISQKCNLRITGHLYPVMAVLDDLSYFIFLFKLLCFFIFLTYIPIDDSFETIIKSHNQFITSVGLEMSEEDQNLPYLYWTPKLHKSPYKHRFIAGSSKCTTKDLSCLLTKLLSTIKDGLVRYCNTKTSRNGVNNMWFLKNSTSLLSSLDQLDVRTAKSVQTFDFSTLYRVFYS